MGVQLTPDEMTDFLTNGHTLILSTIRKSGEPFMMPVWYVYKDGIFYVRTIAHGAKVKHIRRDPRACILVEDGKAWADLRAVIASCDVEILTDISGLSEIEEIFAKKYAAFATPAEAMPDSATKHYAQMQAYLKLIPKPGEIRSWYNRKLRPKKAEV